MVKAVGILFLAAKDCERVCGTPSKYITVGKLPERYPRPYHEKFPVPDS